VHRCLNGMQASIIIHYGEGSSTLGTRVLGQLDLTGIPPAPRDVPRIAVRFALSASHRLSVQVRDLDTQRQKDWSQRGSVVLTVEGKAGQTQLTCK
jgi:molecular chaperone DnaK